MGASPTVVRAPGPLALERELVARLAAARDEVRASPRLLATPLVVVTPSEALRVHLVGSCARGVGALAGVRFTTLARLAHDVLARASAPPATGADAAEILVRRAARAATEQAGERYALAAAASITDLLDAGLAADAEDLLLEALRDGSGRPSLAGAARASAEGLVHAAARARRSIDELGLARRADVLARATVALRRARGAAGCRALWVHGFTDATGLQADLLEALAGACPTLVFWDDAASAPRYGAALRARFGIPERALGDAPPPAPEVFRARGAEAEVREVLRRVRRLLDAGTAPERVAIVARQVVSYAAALRTQAARLAIPISGEGASGPQSAAGRRVRARLALFQDARGAALERWFAAHERRDPDELALLVGLRALGAGRLGDLADLDLGLALADRDELRLPMRVARAEQRDDEDERNEETRDDEGAQLAEVDAVDEDQEDAPPESARTLARSVLEAAVRSARAFVLAADGPDDPRSAAGLRGTSTRTTQPAVEHRERAARLLSLLGAPQDDPLARAVQALADDLGAAFALDAGEFHDALAALVEAEIRDPLGGRGGGVLVTSAALARGRGFEHVFVLGLNAGVFPVAAREDPLLSDEARARLAVVLPDLASKRARAEEESAIYAQLLACAPRTTLSWLVAGADDEPISPSPLLDAAGVTHPEHVPVALGPVEPAESVPQPAHEHALLAARGGTGAEARAVLELALSQARGAHGLDPTLAPRIATARSATRAELDRPSGAAEPLGPFFGGVGPARLEARTKREIAVTTLENVARCPWQAFLQRVLVLKPPLDPLATAPRLDARSTGSVAHALLADTARERYVALEEVEESPGAPPAWPAAEALVARAREHAARILREDGRFAPGLDALVAARALELVAAARRLDEADLLLRVLGAEVQGFVEIPGARRLGFRADRAERSADRLRLTDWKSNRVFGDYARPETRDKHLRVGIARGDHLQGFVYASAAGAGRYVALHPDFTADERRTFEIGGDDEDAARRYASALAALLAAWDAGAFFPRLLEHDAHLENPACKHCELAAACVRGDSGARARLAELAARATEPPPGSHEALARALLALRRPEPKPALESKTRSEGARDSAAPRARKKPAEGAT